MARLRKDHRERQILEIAIYQAKTKGLYSFTVAGVAEAAGCSVPLVKKYVGGMSGLRDAVKKQADSQLLRMSGDLERKALTP